MNDVQLEACWQAYRQQPDKDTMSPLAEAYLPLCRAIAKRFLHRGAEEDDLFQVASLALMKAIARFEPGRGAKFTTFATPTITGEIRNYLRDKGQVIRTSREGRNQLYQMQRLRDSLTQQLMREPTMSELSAAMGITPEELLALLDMRAASQVASMDAPVTEEEETRLGEMLGRPETGFEQVENRDWLKWVFSQVTPQEKELLLLRYDKRLGQRETAKLLNMSQMQVSRLERRILTRLSQISGIK